MTFQTLQLSQIQTSEGNPRKRFNDDTIAGLAQSIKADGLLQNLIVGKSKGKKKLHSIICGERRFRALQLLQTQGDLPQDFVVPVEIKENLSEEETLRIATMENVQRENLSPMEEAQAIAALVQDGEKLDDIISKTGLALSTLQRRLTLIDLSPAVKEALTNGDISISQAEALSVGSHERQDGILGYIKEGHYYPADTIKDQLVGRLPTLSMAIFDKAQYTGEYTTDLFAEEDTTYFNDVEQFLELQRAAAEELVQKYAKTEDWAELCEGYFSSYYYTEAEDGEIGGVIVSFSCSGEVEVHKGLVKSKADSSTTEALKKPRATYSVPLVRNMAMHKTLAVQAALLENPRTSKELAVVYKFYDFNHHAALTYFDDVEDINQPPALRAINEKAKALLSALWGDVSDETTWYDLGYKFRYDAEAVYDVVQTFSDDDLETLLLTLEAFEFGQEYCDRLDTNENTIFNRIAKDIGVDMRNYWRPDVEFLKRRNKPQLQQIITDTGSSKKIGDVNTQKKKDLVTSMAKHFQDVLALDAPNEEEQNAISWLPEIMQFPAIDPDVKSEE